MTDPARRAARAAAFWPPLVAAIGFGAWALLRAEEQATAAAERRDALEATAVAPVFLSLRAGVAQVQSLGAFFAASDAVTAGEFRTYTSHVLRQTAGLAHLEWVARVPAGGTTAFEANVSAAEGAPFSVRPVAAADAAEHFVVLHVEPTGRLRDMRGFDLASVERRRRQLTLARDSGRAVVDRALSEVGGADPVTQTLVFLPVYRGGATPADGDERARLHFGFAAGILRLSDVLPPPATAGTALRVTVLEGDGPVVLHESPAATAAVAAGEPATLARTVSLGGRLWTVEAFDAGPAGPGHTGPSAFLLAGALALAGGLWFHLSRHAAHLREARSLEDAERRAHALHRAFLTTTPTLVAVLDPGGRILTANPALAAAAGRDRTSLPGEIFSDTGFTPAGAADLRTRLAALRPGDAALRHEGPYLSARGDERWVEWNVSAVAGERGGVGYLVASGLDRTERHTVDRAFRALASLPAGGPEFFAAVAEAAARILRCEVAFVGHLVEPERSRIRTLALLVDGVLQPSVEYPLAGTPCAGVVGLQPAVLRDGVQQSYPEDAYLRDLGIRGYAAVPLFSGDGTPLGHIGVMARRELVDPSMIEGVLNVFAARVAGEIVRRRGEEALRAGEERFRVAAEQTGQVVYEWEPGTGAIRRAGAIEAVTGSRPEDLAHASVDDWFERVHPEDRERVRAALDAARAAHGRFSVAYRIRRADGTWADIEDRGVFLAAGGGRALRLVGSMEDVSDRRRLEGALAQSQKLEAVGRLAGGIAHDFNNLLTAIGGFAELASMRTRPDEPVGRYLEQILRATGSASALTRQILAFSRRTQAAAVPCRPAEIVVAMEKMLRRLLPEHHRLEIVASAPEVVVIADPGHLEQVVLNLVVNARDAMPTGGTIRVEISAEEPGEDAATRVAGARAGRHAVISVADTGIGMTADVRARIFEPFFTTKEPGKGTGLGLATVYAALRQAGGFIDVSTEPGRGSTFRACIPEAPAGAAARSARPPADAGSGEHIPRGDGTVLLVDDDLAVAAVAEGFLAGAGYRVLAANGAAAALAVARGHAGPIRAVVSDIVMPGAGAEAFVVEFQRIRPGVPVLCVSGSEDDAAAAALRARNVPILPKPFTAASLTGALADLLRRTESGVGAAT